MADFRSKYAQQGVMEVAVKGQFSPSQGLIACSITPLPPNVQCHKLTSVNQVVVVQT
jgi:hypothetical protein